MRLENSRLKKLQKRETLELDKVFKAIPDLYFRLDTGNKIVDYNALEDSDLYSGPREFIGKKIEDIFSLKHAEQFEKAIDEARKTKSLVKVEYSLPLPGGKKEYEARLLTFRKDHIIVVVHDISERKKMEEALKTYQFFLEEIIEARTVDLKIANEKLKLEIDERIRIGKALKESEEKFRLIFNRGNDAKFVYPFSEKGMGHFVEVNEIACKRLGYSKEELLRLSPKDISHSDSFKNAPDLMRKLNKDGRVVFEAVHMTKDGREIPVEISSQVFNLNKKKMILSIARDISERKKKEEEIRKQNIFLKNVIESLNHPFYVIDAIDYKVKMANSYSSLQKGIPCYKQTHHLDKPCDLHGKVCPLKMIKEKKRSVTVEHVHLDKGGKERFVEVHGHPIFDSEGNVIQLIEYTIDITKQKRVFEEANTLANVIRQTTDCIVLTDLSGNIQYVNPMFEKITGYAFEEVNGKNPRILRSENAAYPSGFYEKLWDTIGNGNIWNGEFLNKKKNGEDYIEEASIFPVRDQQTGEIICYGAVKKDITLRRELEEKLKKSYKEVVSLKEKAESASRLKSQFLANMSHDIRTPLNTIMGFANLLLKGEQRAVQRDYLKNIQVSGQGLLNLINDILDFSKIEAGQLDFYKQTFLLKDFMESIGSIFEIQFKKKKIDFEKIIAKNVPDMVYNDKWRMSQVLVNLLSNALKFTDEGNVSIHTDYNKSKDRIVFKVKDTGVGIEKKYFEKIFEPFSQVYSSNAFDKKGTGLGLAICKNLTTLLGGDLTVHSKPGIGSEFTFEIPANSNKIESRREAVIDNRVMERKMDIEVKKNNKILIAEDNLVNQVLLVEQFKNEGFVSILIAENGREAIDVASEQDPDLILMDIQMPLMNGNEAIAELRKRGYQGPILALSALARREDIEKSLEAGAVDYITKPIDFDKFFIQISKYLKVKQKQNKNSKETAEAKKSSNKIKESTSQRVRNAYIKDAKGKLNVIKGILKNKNFEESKKELKVIAHGYKGNARYLGLDNLEIAANVLDNGLNNDEPDNIIRDLTQKMADILKSIIEENS